MKSGTNTSDRNRIREWHAEGATPEVIARNLKINVEVVEGCIAGLEAKKKPKAKAKPKAKVPAPSESDLGDDIPPGSIEV